MLATIAALRERTNTQAVHHAAQCAETAVLSDDSDDDFASLLDDVSFVFVLDFVCGSQPASQS